MDVAPGGFARDPAAAPVGAQASVERGGGLQTNQGRPGSCGRALLALMDAGAQLDCRRHARLGVALDFAGYARAILQGDDDAATPAAMSASAQGGVRP